MLLAPARTRPRWTILIAAILASSVPLLTVLPAVVWQTRKNANDQALEQMQQARIAMDDMLDQASATAAGILPHAGLPCWEGFHQMLREAAIHPFLRSVALTRGAQIYCNSMSGSISYADPAANYAGGRLRLTVDDRNTPGVPLLKYRERGPRGDVIVNIDARYVQLMLRTLPQERPLYITIGQRWLGPGLTTGDSRQLKPSTSLASLRYPYTLQTNLEKNPGHWLGALQQNAMLAVVLILLGALGGLTLYWLLSRPASTTGELRRALLAGEFEGFLQPFSRPGQPGWQGAELLMRWRHPQLGLIQPDLFIPLAERTGMIVPLTRTVVLKAIENLRGAKLPPGFHLGINISRAHLERGILVAHCKDMQARLAEIGVQLTLEVTEHAAIDPTPEIQAQLQELKALGIKLALDDFGTGHSTLAWLQNMRVDFLKIDRSFVSGIGRDSLSAHIVDTVAELAAKLGMESIAEGVETEEQAEYLGRIGVHWLQGYYIARPMPIDQFIVQLNDPPAPRSDSDANPA